MNRSTEKDALSYANVIGILRIFDDEKIKWLAPRKMNENVTYKDIEKCGKEIETALLQKDYNIVNNFAVGCFKTFNGSISAVFNEIFTKNNYSHIDTVELYTKESISESKSEKLILYWQRI